MLIQACLNGSRRRSEHRGLPITADEIAHDAAAVMRAGAGCVHVHPRREDGVESLEPDVVGAMLRAVRIACPGLPVGVTTAAWIEPDAARRGALIDAWQELPDFASVNLSEDGAVDMIDRLGERGVGIEVGVWSEADARMLVQLGLDDACLRVLVEVEAAGDGASAVQLAANIDALLDDGLSQAPRLHHGGDAATWSVLAAAMAKGHDVRIGLEDTLVLEDGTPVSGNEALVWATSRMALEAGRSIEPA
jgi:uncharacterized protein (DUF849 family)